jgi:hypothetical protein
LLFQLFLDFLCQQGVAKSRVTGDLSPFFLPFGASGGVRHVGTLTMAAFRVQAIEPRLTVLL